MPTKKSIAKITRPKIKDLEKWNPKGQKQLAKQLGVSTRTLRYWKTGERKPTKAHAREIKVKHTITGNYIKGMMKVRKLSERQVTKQVKHFYNAIDKPGIPDWEKWIPLYIKNMTTVQEEAAEKTLTKAQLKRAKKTELERRLGV